jgi:LysM repeat protein
MGGKSGVSLPKVKISAPKAISKAVGAVTNPLSKAVAGAGKGIEKVVSSAAKGDIKGVAGAGMGLVDTAKNLAKDSALQNLSLGTGALGALGSLTGAKDISKLASNINAEGERGVNKYGDAALDVGANVATGGTYGLAKTATQSLASGGLGGLISGKGLQDAALGAAGSYAGIDPNMLKMGMSAAQGDLKGAALQGLGSFAGLSPDQMKMATTGAAALTGDKKGLASGLASQFGAGDSVANMIGSAAGGDIKGALLGKLAGSTGVPQDILKQVSTGKFDVGELAKNANLTASLGDAAQAYMPGSADILNRAGEARDQVRAIQDVQKAAESSYKIAKGDTLNAIAKKMGVDPKALAAANNIKDPNKIMAGMNLKIPSAVKQAVDSASGARKSITDKYLKDANGNTIYGPNNAPIANPDYNREEADKLAIQQQGGTGKEITLPEEPGFLDKAKDFLGGVGDKISGAVGAAGDFIKENPNVAATAVQGAAAVGGYMAGEASREEREKLLEKQILETQGVNALKNYQLSKERDKAYGEQQQFLEDRIAGGGMTAKEREMQQQGQMRAAKMAAAGRLAGVEQQARMGQGVTGAGSALAASLAGAQSQAQAGAESERAAATSAAENVEKAYSARPAALEAKAKSEMDLAQMKDVQELAKLQQIGASRAGLGAIEAGRGDAQGRLIAAGADLATGAIYDRPVLASNATEEERKIAAQAEADRKKALDAKAAAAGAVSQTAPTQGNAQTVGQKTPAATPAPQTQADKFNQAGQVPKPAPAPQPGQGQGYGVLAPIQNIVKNPAQALKNPTQAVQAAAQESAAIAKKKLEDAAKQKAEQLKQQGVDAAKKAVGGIVPDSMKNIFKF